MDIHRSRFVPYPPSAINALAFSHAQADNDRADPECLRLAVGRANGNIEIWNPARGAWVQERVFPGGKDRSVEGLVWTQEPDEINQQGKTIAGKLRLFSIGYSNSITEWDLLTGLPARHSSGSHSEVWCFAAQPRRKPKKNSDAAEYQKLVAGCADGTVVLLSTENDDVRFEKFLARSSTKKARVLSITYKDQNVVLAGFADSTIKVLDSRNGTVIRNISLGSGPIGGPKEILVWKVKCLPDGDFVSGDSTGDIRIYDGKNYSQVQRISGHEADVLDLAVSQDGTMIFSGGMDRRTCFYTCSKTRNARGEKWRKVSHQRYHDHDVKAMATYEGNQLNVIVSGGIDTQPVVLPLRHFGLEHSRALPGLPLTPPIVSAPLARLMASWWNREIRIWRVKSKAEGAEKPKVVARIAIQGEDNITSVSISRDGTLLAVATASEVKLFHLAPADPSMGPALRIRKLEMPVTKGAKLVRLADNGKWLAMVTVTNDIQLARIVESDDPTERPRVLPQLLPLYRLRRDELPRDPFNGPWGSYDRSITQAEFSTDSNVFAVADLGGYLDTWIVAGYEDITAPEFDVGSSAHTSATDDGEDSDDDEEEELRKKVITVFGQRWVRNPSGHLLPRLDAAPLLLSFKPLLEGSTRPEPNGTPAMHATRNNPHPHPHSHDTPDVEQQLLVVTAKLELSIVDVLAGRLSEWSRKNPPSVYPSQFRRLDDPVKGCIWDTAENKNRLWLYGEKWLFMFDLSTDFPMDTAEGADAVESTPATKKRKRALVKEAGRKMNSGAGSTIPLGEAPVAKLRKFTSGKGDKSGRSAWIELGSTRHGSGSDEDAYDDLEVRHQVLASMRQSQANDDSPADAVMSVEDAGDKDSSGDDKRRRHESWWNTFKYRPILGIAPVGPADEPLEVVLVERPSWDLDLPPRFVGIHE